MTKISPEDMNPKEIYLFYQVQVGISFISIVKLNHKYVRSSATWYNFSDITNYLRRADNINGCQVQNLSPEESFEVYMGFEVFKITDDETCNHIIAEMI